MLGDLPNDQSNPGGEAQLDVEYIMVRERERESKRKKELVSLVCDTRACVCGGGGAGGLPCYFCCA